MTDPISFFLFDPIGLTVTITLVAALGFLLYFVFFNTDAKANFVIERIKPGFSIIRKVKEVRTKNPGDLLIEFPDGRKFTVPSGMEGQCETLEVPKTIRIKKGWRHFWWLESNRLVKLGWSLLSPPTEIMDNQTSTVVANRKSAGRLATAKGIVAANWTTVILGVGMGLAVGYIMYPQFNHPGTVIEYCKGAGQNLTCGLTP